MKSRKNIRCGYLRMSSRGDTPLTPQWKGEGTPPPTPVLGEVLVWRGAWARCLYGEVLGRGAWVVRCLGEVLGRGAWVRCLGYLLARFPLLRSVRRAFFPLFFFVLSFPPLNAHVSGSFAEHELSTIIISLFWLP